MFGRRRRRHGHRHGCRRRRRRHCWSRMGGARAGEKMPSIYIGSVRCLFVKEGGCCARLWGAAAEVKDYLAGEMILAFRALMSVES